MGEVEGLFSKALVDLDEPILGDDTLRSILIYSLIQSVRTEHSFHRSRAQFHALAPLMPDEWKHEIDTALRPEDILSSIPELIKSISDLKVVIIENATRTGFVLSDDPAVVFNKYFSQKNILHLGAGIESAGAAIVLPVSPFKMMLAYDSDVYSLDNVNSKRVVLSRDRDVDEWNQIQFLRANECVYFLNTNLKSTDLAQKFDEVAVYRPERWFDVTFAVPTEMAGGHQKYDVVSVQEAMDSDKNVLIHTSIKPIRLGRWPRMLKFRQKPKFIDTETGRGLVRRSQL